MPGLLAHPDYTRERVRQVARLARRSSTRTRGRPTACGSRGPSTGSRPLRPRRWTTATRALGMELGPLWATWWLEVEAAVPAAWEGEQVDLLLVTNSEATLWLDGEPAQGLVSGGASVCGLTPAHGAGGGGRGLEGAGRDRLQRAVRMVRAASAAPRAAAARRAAVSPGALRARALRPRGLGALAATSTSWSALMDEPGADDAWRGRAAARAQPLLQRVGRRGPRDVAGRRARSSARCSSAAQRDADARDHRRRPRAHRHGVAVAARGDQPQVRADVRDAAAAHGATTPSTASRCSQAQQYAWMRDALPGAVRAHPRARRRRAVGAGRRHVGRARLQPARRASRSCARSSTASASSRRVRPPRDRCSGSPTCSATAASSRRSCAARASTASSRRRSRGTTSTRPAPHVLVGGHRRLAVLTHFPPADTYNGEVTVAELRRARARLQDHARSARSLLVVRLRRRWRRPDAREMLETSRRAGRPGRRAAHDDRPTPRRSSRALEAERGELARGVGELYLEYHRGTYTTQAATKRGNRRGGARAARRRAARALAAGSGGAVPARRARRGVEDAAAQPVPRHHPGLLDQLGLRAAPSATTPRSRRRADAMRDAALGRARRRARRHASSVGAGARWSTRRRPRPRRGAGVRVGRSSTPATPSASATPDGGRARERASARDVVTATACCVGVARGGGREVLAAPGNVFQLYEDNPVAYDAWDVDPFHLETPRDCSPATRVAVLAASRCAPRSPFVRPFGTLADEPDDAARRGVARGSSSAATIDWHEDHRAAEGRVPGRGARARAPPTRCSSAPSSARRTTRRAATSRSSRSPATASPTSPSTASAWPCSTPRSTAGRVHGDGCG